MNSARGWFRRIVWLAPAAALGGAACAADPTPGLSDGGGGGGAGVGLDCTSNLVSGDNTLSDFESGSGAVVQTAGRNGAWYAYNDQSATCSEDPAQGAMNAPAAKLDTTRCGSTYAFRMRGMACSVWGAGMGTDLAAPLPDDGGPPDTTQTKIPYDLSGYREISFWGRVGAGSTAAVRFKLPMLVDTKVVDGGRCQLSETGTDKCSDDWGRALTFTTSWKMFKVPLVDDPVGGLSTEGWGKKFALDLTNITALQFQVGPGTTYDVWVDDVNLTPR